MYDVHFLCQNYPLITQLLIIKEESKAEYSQYIEYSVAYGTVLMPCYFPLLHMKPMAVVAH
jgi:hypothetical protein